MLISKDERNTKCAIQSFGRKESTRNQILPFYASVNESQKSTPRNANFTRVNHTRPSSTLHNNSNSIVHPKPCTHDSSQRNTSRPINHFRNLCLPVHDTTHNLSHSTRSTFNKSRVTPQERLHRFQTKSPLSCPERFCCFAGCVAITNYCGVFAGCLSTGREGRVHSGRTRMIRKDRKNKYQTGFVGRLEELKRNPSSGIRWLCDCSNCMFRSRAKREIGFGPRPVCVCVYFDV